MWPGVYGDGSSRKNLMASCDASLRRTGLDYFDVFYSHRYDGVTPIEETIQALIDIVRQGKALYAGLSKYPPREQQRAYDILREAKVPCLLSQDRASIFDTKAIDQNFGPAAANGERHSVLFATAQGLLTDRYLHGIPEGSQRRRERRGFLKRDEVSVPRVEAARRLNDIASRCGMSLAQMAIACCLPTAGVTSVIVGASSVEQLLANIKAVDCCGALTEAYRHEIAIIASAPGVSMSKAGLTLRAGRDGALYGSGGGVRSNGRCCPTDAMPHPLS